MRLPAAVFVIVSTLLLSSTAAAQSLFLMQGERAVDGSVGSSLGPFSDGLELQVGGSLDGRWDVAFGFNRYTSDLGGPDDTTFTEWSPSVRYFLFKETDDGMPVSFAPHAALFQANYEDDTESWYVLLGGQLFKRFDFTNSLAMFPYVGFSLAGESFPVSSTDNERSIYLTRQFGVHTLIAIGSDAWVRVTIEEHSFRRETYRAARVGYVRRF